MILLNSIIPNKNQVLEPTGEQMPLNQPTNEPTQTETAQIKIGNEDLWQSVLAQIQFNVSRANFATWFRNTRIISNQNGEVLISVPNSFSREWISGKYQTAILKILRELDNNIRLVEFIVEANNKEEKKDNEINRMTEKILFSEPQQQFQELNINQKTNLNGRYVFENFVVGEFNELAHAASWAVAEAPGITYNPLFIYGGVGLGKTHLLQATGNRITLLFPKLRVLYSNSERLVSRIIESIRNQTIGELKNSLNKLDVLIVDDIHFLAGKDKTQEEFFHVFNTLFQNQKQIILSSDRPPNAIPAIEDRLRSRFEGGMIADISFPTLESRMAILKTKCEQNEITLSDEILEYLAANIQKNIRDMEGALNRVAALQKINKNTIDLAIVKRLLHASIVAPKKSTNFKKIIQAVANFYDLGKDDLLLATRRKEIVRPRQIAMYLLRQELQESFPSIGRRFQGKDHTTAIYAFERVSQRIEQEPLLSADIALIKQRLYSEA
ncbi:chromosomal replication initiator protein DnaA [bacterium (Candidatus Gribaldobacteria) CG08_land_8_20_14_0_20_39_15]|uniref:Chromosomal replication initiator protein DnaA n=1 Tax=bacterium (Candidatus Gribaldobacteria) CG08_land_8_20_14_0_20_39_15 TaxID=2014273 RepID=A0A2M6XV94_9BACT|nr:MAG: chromosomal replication initiator protein DnaA [bacterium (Candidatus Gribaldobacteria) CG08_land_8_20_14_0_20_39_15]